MGRIATAGGTGNHGKRFPTFSPARYHPFHEALDHLLEEVRMPVPVPVAVLLVGVHGHGRWHLKNIDRLRRAGAPVRLAGVCDTRPPADEQRDLIGDVPVAARLDELLDAVRPEVTIVCTPIHTHADLTLTAAAAGSHVLLEKPPTTTLAGFERLVSGLTATGRACQVGFQSLGSHAVPHIRALIADGSIGDVIGIGGAGAPSATWRSSTAR
jgi:predicted dehydrogenase